MMDDWGRGFLTGVAFGVMLLILFVMAAMEKL